MSTVDSPKSPKTRSLPRKPQLPLEAFGHSLYNRPCLLSRGLGSSSQAGSLSQEGASLDPWVRGLFQDHSHIHTV